MRILLVGEFSRLHNSLKEGLVKLGHEVTIISSGDGMKKFATDIDISSFIAKHTLLKRTNSLFIRFLNIDFIKYEHAYKFKKRIPELKGFDIIQLINEDFIFAKPKTEIQLLKKLISQNNKFFLLCCGEDYTTINYYLNTPENYSIITPYLKNKSLKKRYTYSLKYITKPYKELHDFIAKKSKGVIATDIDYHIPMLKEHNYLGMIPNPVNIDTIKYKPIEIGEKINIFHGINSHSNIKKGSIFIKEALKIIKEKYPDKVSIKITQDLPYTEYIKIYDDAHILIDQVYGYDQGYNALEAMAKGKVVFTGAEKEWLEYYNLKEDTVAINALPDANQIVDKLEWLILNPEKLIEISKNARHFIEKEHSYKSIAQKYVEFWKG